MPPPDASQAPLAASDADKKGPSLLDKVEQGSKIFATVLVPVILALIGWWVQASIEKSKQDATRTATEQQQKVDTDKISLEYVKLAKDILGNPSMDEGLRDWSWELIDQLSPRKFDPGVLEGIKKRNATLPPPDRPAQAPATKPSDLNGFVVFVMRGGVETRGSGPLRTVGHYHVFYDGQKLPGLEGATVEARGPGDNSTTGTRNHARLEAGVYPLWTQAGQRFRTIGYAADGSRSPGPAILIGETGNRQSILIYASSGFAQGLGTITLSKTIDGPQTDVDYADSRARVIAVIDAMKGKLGSHFPAAGINARIPNAWVVIAGEPSDFGTDASFDGAPADK